MLPLVFRGLEKTDCQALSESFQLQGWNKPESQFLAYLSEQEIGARDAIVASVNGSPVGYLTIKWESNYATFKNQNIPEVVDLNVLIRYQGRGVGSALMDVAETRIRKVSPYAGIGVGLIEDYGAAQRLYIKRGYIPDGKGCVKNSLPLKFGEKITVDDDLVLYLIKEL